MAWLQIDRSKRIYECSLIRAV